MKKKNGFTLVELLAMLVIMGILMVVAIPNITGILSNQKVNSLKSDATNLIETAKVKIAKDTSINKPTPQQCLFFTLDALDENDDFSKGPNGGEYMRYESFVVATRESGISAGTTKYSYYVRLVEKISETEIAGIDVVEESKVKDLKGKDVKKITLIGLNADKPSSLTLLKNKYKVENTNPPKCNASSVYYTHLNRCGYEGTSTFFDENGNPTTEANWIAKCRKCIYYRDKYYGLAGNEVTAAVFASECN